MEPTILTASRREIPDMARIIGVSGSPNTHYDWSRVNSGIAGSTGEYVLRLSLDVSQGQPPAGNSRTVGSVVVQATSRREQVIPGRAWPNPRSRR